MTAKKKQHKTAIRQRSKKQVKNTKSVRVSAFSPFFSPFGFESPRFERFEERFESPFFERFENRFFPFGETPAFERFEEFFEPPFFGRRFF